MRKVQFEQEGFDQFTAWADEDHALFARLTRLIRETARNPFDGIGKPEPLRHNLKGYWSRRMSAEHRLVYKVTAEALIIVSCRHHYQ
jgi:toxin YoeB